MTDPHRPQYHFLPPANWMNDPNGLIQWKGQYHMFYQYNPHGAFHGTIHWGHAVSTDLVHWQHLPIGLSPTPDSIDKDGCWSGCVIDHNGIPTLFYTGVHPQVQCMAISSDALLTWQKHPQPVISAPPPNIEPYAGGQIRDPFVWKENDQWYMVLGSKIEGVGGVILLYRSVDLLHWEYLHPVLTGAINRREPLWTGTMWECPNVLDFGSKHVLIISPQAMASDHLEPIYYAGNWDNEHFQPESCQVLVHGKYFYAPQVLCADDGRHIMWGWVKEGCTSGQSLTAGWSGVMSLPIQLSLLPDGKLGMEPAQELERLRQDHYHFDDLKITPARDFLPDISGNALEIKIQMSYDLQTEIGLILQTSSDAQEQTRVIYQPEHQQLVVQRFNPNPGVDIDSHFVPLALQPDELLTLRVFLDHSVLEVFANGHTCLVTRIYPVRGKSSQIGLFTGNNPAVVKTLDIWKLKDIWN